MGMKKLFSNKFNKEVILLFISFLISFVVFQINNEENLYYIYFKNK